MVEWKDESVTDHSGGITDLVTASGSEFQELCNNLGHNTKLQLLSSREGYRRFTEAETPAAIEQLFRLEDWIIALCSDGNLYYRLESDTITPWVQVLTPKARTATIFRIYDSTGKGVTLRHSTGVYDQLVVNAGNNAGTTPDAAFSTPTVTITVQLSDLNSSKQYNTGSGNLDWSWFASATFTGAGFFTAYLSGTLSTDDVRFDGLLAVQETASPQGLYPVNVRSDGDGGALTFAPEDGHLQPSEWQSHLFMALEPFVKTFTANASDPYGEDPDQFPPTNQRLPLRKVAPLQPAIGSGSTAVALTAMNAQLPKVYIGTNTAQSVYGASYSNLIKDYRYQVYRIRWDYKSAAYSSDQTAWIEIWAERSWGLVGPAGVMTDKQYFRGETASAVNGIVPANAFALVDYTLSTVGVAPYNAVPGGVVWGDLVLLFHSMTAGITDSTMTFEDVVEAVETAFREYQTRKTPVLAGSVRYAGHRNFGYYLKVSPSAKVTELVDLSNSYIDDHFYADALRDDVAGNHSYGYAAYLRNSYKGAYEGAPRDFLFDGPAAFLSARTLSPVGIEPVVGYTEAARTNAYSFPTAPGIFAGISASLTRTTDLHFQSQMEMIFARNLDGGETFYIDEASKYWYRAAAVSAPTVPQVLIDDAWQTKNSFIVPHQSDTTDDILTSAEEAYFNGQIVSYDSLPQGPYYFTVVNQTGYYAHIVGNIQRVYQSPPGNPYASPAVIFEDFDDEITGITSFSDKPIVTTAKRIQRIEGVKSSDGSGRTFLRTVSDVYGCIANQSIVVTTMGVFLWSQSGIIWTDGIKAASVTEHLIKRYDDWLTGLTGGVPTIGPEELRGAYDQLGRKVYWSLTDAAGKPFFVVLSLDKGMSSTMPVVTEDGVRFRSVDSGGTVTDIDYFETHATVFSPSRQRWYRGQQTFLMIRDNARTYDDSHVDGLRHPIEPYFKSVAYAYGIPWARKRTSKIQLNLRDLTKTGVSLTPLGWNDLSETPHRLRSCLNYQHMNFSLDYATATPLDLQQFFRHTDCKWNSHQIVTYKRGFGRGRQRNCFKQVGFEGLRLKFGEITGETPGITSLQVIHKAIDVPSPGDFPEATVYIEITTAGTAVSSLLLDASGQFYVTWDDSMDPVPISDYSVVGTLHRIKALPGTSNPTNTAEHVESWPDVKFYRVFTDQRIDLLGYNLTYRLIGDRTQGALKSEEKGGVNA